MAPRVRTAIVSNASKDSRPSGGLMKDEAAYNQYIVTLIVFSLDGKRRERIAYTCSHTSKMWS